MRDGSRGRARGRSGSHVRNRSWSGARSWHGSHVSDRSSSHVRHWSSSDVRDRSSNMANRMSQWDRLSRSIRLHRSRNSGLSREKSLFFSLRLRVNLLSTHRHRDDYVGSLGWGLERE